MYNGRFGRPGLGTIIDGGMRPFSLHKYRQAPHTKYVPESHLYPSVAAGGGVDHEERSASTEENTAPAPIQLSPIVVLIFFTMLQQIVTIIVLVVLLFVINKR